MLDQMSNEPLPSRQSCANEVVNNLYYKKFLHTAPYNIYIIERHKLMNKALALIIEENPQYSLAAWHMGGCTDFEDKMIQWLSKRIGARRKIKGIIKTLGLLYMIYKDSIEKMYAIGGTFVSEAAMRWNPILQGTDGETLPVPPTYQCLKLTFIDI